MDDLRPTIAASMAAITEYARHARRRGFLATVLQPLFSALPLETQLHLSTDAMQGMIAASVVAKDEWGVTGAVVIHGNEYRVGKRIEGSDEIEVLGRGPTPHAAFRDAWTRTRSP